MQTRYLLALFTATVMTTFTSQAKSTPSFSCQAKLTANEQLICTNSELSQLDKQIADTFFSLTAILNRAAATLVRQDQKQFLKTRQKCRSDFSCTQTLMNTRLQQLETALQEQQSFRNSAGKNDLNDEEENDNPCGPGFTFQRGQCLSHADIELQKMIGNTRPLASGRYGIYVLSHEDSLRLDAAADKMLYTQDKAGNRNAPKQSFFVVYQNGSYSITDEKSGLRLHADGGGDKKVSARYQPRDDFTKFRLTPALDGCYHIQTIATGNYWIWEPNSQVIIVRKKTAGEESMFCFMPQ